MKNYFEEQRYASPRVRQPQGTAYWDGFEGSCDRLHEEGQGGNVRELVSFLFPSPDGTIPTSVNPSRCTP